MASGKNWLDVSLSNSLTMDIQESGGHGINQSASRNNMVAASYFPQLVIGYNNDELPLNSTAPKLETVNASALRQNAGPLRHNARPLSFMELLDKPNTAGMHPISFVLTHFASSLHLDFVLSCSLYCKFILSPIQNTALGT